MPTFLAVRRWLAPLATSPAASIPRFLLRLLLRLLLTNRTRASCLQIAHQTDVISQINFQDKLLGEAIERLRREMSQQNESEHSSW